ncbi:hypothetical protein ACNO5E_15785 [Vibrio parahaemolyticus]|uniref:hypothetical protein n=1 Tax=Vibrio parahaemolyticus TaxID=670 RepID=UPI000812DBCA|nr:hypothetical protein [Vibrio parahaemolyticus]OCP68339.1 hypothetical protein AKH08_16115 [Vibrio parahaemolyticus]
MIRVLVIVMCAVSPLSMADEVDDLFKVAMEHYRNAVFCVGYHRNEVSHNLDIQSAYFSIGQSVNKLQKHVSGDNDWTASDIISHIVIREAAEQKMGQPEAQLKNRCENILNYGLSKSAATLRENITRLEEEGKL